MDEVVFVSAANVKCPGIGDISELGQVARGKGLVPLSRVLVGEDEVLLGEEILLDRASPFYPTRSNEKVMRKEVIAATLGVCELITGISEHAPSPAEIPLFVAAGSSMERQIGDVDWFSRAFRAMLECSSGRERNKRLSQLTPPLLALRTLTNATSSFIAEQTSVAGNNTTFGSTSLSGFYALKEGYDAVRAGRCPMAIVGGASRGGIASYFMFRNFFPDVAGWKESICSAFLLLESGSSLRERSAGALCELGWLSAAGAPPSLSRTDTAVPFARFAERAGEASLAVYSGAFCESEHERLRAAVTSTWAQAESLFGCLGSGGTSNVFLNILAGVALSSPGLTIDCLDRDPYARESLVRISIPSS